MSKGITKKNEQKLKIYLSTQNDIKPSQKPDQNNSAVTPAGKKL